jgi:hypothetical protein
MVRRAVHLPKTNRDSLPCRCDAPSANLVGIQSIVARSGVHHWAWTSLLNFAFSPLLAPGKIEPGSPIWAVR